MAARKSTTAKAAVKAVETVAQGDEMARKIWLAGVGAYGQLFTEAQGGFDKWSDKAQAAFDDLVNRGAVMEDMVKAKIAGSEQGAAIIDMAERLQKEGTERRAKFTARVEAVGKAMGEKLAPYAAFMPGASAAKLDELAAQVAALTAEVKALKAAKAAPRAAAAKAEKPVTATVKAEKPATRARKTAKA
jgi:outer membrane murein-binding lipoprotein Lpp